MGDDGFRVCSGLFGFSGNISKSYLIHHLHYVTQWTHQFPKYRIPVECRGLIFEIPAVSMQLQLCGHHQGTMKCGLRFFSSLEGLCQITRELSVSDVSSKNPPYLRMPIVFAVGVSVTTLVAVVSLKYSS